MLGTAYLHDERNKSNTEGTLMSSIEAEQNWQEDVLRILKAHDVKHVVFVLDAGHSAAIRMSYDDPDIKAVVLTTEEEGIGYLAAAWLGGERGALLMQSSGAGSCINTLALQNCAGFPLLMFVTMRGAWA